MFDLKQAVRAGFIGVLIITANAKLPDEHLISNLDIRPVRKGYLNAIENDNKSVFLYHPFLAESINAVLGYYKTPVTLKRHNVDCQDTTADYYVELLKENAVTIYKMEKLQGKVLRGILHSNIPVLLIGKHREPYRNITRVHGDVVYTNRKPDYSQSTKKYHKDIVYVFQTARGFCLEGKEYFRPAVKELAQLPLHLRVPGGGLGEKINEMQEKTMVMESNIINPLKNKPFNIFDYYCIVATAEMPLEKIKKRINKSLDDVSFEYKLPRFVEMDPRVLVW